MKSSPTSSSTEWICSGKNTVDSVWKRGESKQRESEGVKIKNKKGNDMYNNLQKSTVH